MVDCRAREFAVHVRLWWWSIAVRVRRKDHIPLVIDVVELRRPQVRRVVHALGRDKCSLGRSVIPVAIKMISTRELLGN